MLNKTPRSSLGVLRSFLRAREATSTPSHQGRASFRTRQFPRRWHPGNRVRKPQGHLLCAPVVRRRGKSWGALRKARKVLSPDREPGIFHHCRNQQNSAPPRRLHPADQSMDLRETPLTAGKPLHVHVLASAVPSLVRTWITPQVLREAERRRADLWGRLRCSTVCNRDGRRATCH